MYFWIDTYDPQPGRLPTLWRTSGTAESTYAIRSFADSGGPSHAERQMVASAGRLYFLASDITGADRQLWQSDGTAARTSVIKTSDGTSYRNPYNLSAVGNKIYLTAAPGNEPYPNGENERLFVVTDDGPPVASPGTIAGTVFEDRDRDASLDPDEPPLPGYRVFLDYNNDGRLNGVEPWVRANSKGRYSFPGIAPGRYFVRQTTVETRLPTTPVVYKITLGEGQRIVRSFGHTGGTISGAVFRDANRNGLRDAGETGMASAHVFLDADNDGLWDETEHIVRTRSTGRYTFSNVLAGTYRIRVFEVPGWTFTNPAVRKATLEAGGAVTRYLG